MITIASAEQAREYFGSAEIVRAYKNQPNGTNFYNALVSMGWIPENLEETLAANPSSSIRQPLATLNAVPVAEPSCEQQRKADGLIQPDANGEFPTPLDGALWMASLGVAQIPLRAGTKDAFLTAFQTLATTDTVQIRKWAAEFPGCNFGSVSLEGKTFVFEADSADVRERFEKLGHGTFTSKLIVQSSPGKGHRYYLSVPGIKSVQQAFTKHGDFSVRVKNQYCVSPGSLHPTTRQQYRVIFHDVANGLTRPTEQEVAFWDSERVKANDLNKEVPRSLTGLVAHGAIHGFMLREAGKLRQLGYDVDIIEQALLQTVHRNCEPPISEDRVRQMARSICKYPAGTSTEIIFNQHAELDDEEEETFGEPAREKFPECPVFPGALTALARAIFPSLPLEFKMWGLMTRWGLMRSGIDRLKLEPHLQTRLYTIFVCYPNTGKTACVNETRNATDAIVARVMAERDKANNSSPTPRVCANVTNLFSVDSGPFLASEFFKVSKEAQEAFIAGTCTDANSKLLIDTDELKDIFEKARTSNNRTSTIFIELLKLHSGNKTGNGTVRTGHRPVTNAHLAIVAGSTVANYPALWVGTGGGTDGLRSRFNVVTTNNPQVPPEPLPTDVVEAEKAYTRLVRLAQLPAQTITFAPEAAKMLNDWWKTVDSNKESTTRVLELLKQVLIILAVVNAPEDHAGDTLTVGPELMAEVIKYGEYEIASRERFNQGDSWAPIQSMEQAIIKWFQENAGRTCPKSRNEARRGIHPHLMQGGLGAFKSAWDNCVNTGVLKLRAKNQRSGLYSI